MSPERVMRVVVGDEHRLYRTGLSRRLVACPMIDVVAECSNGFGALAEIRRLAPDVAVLDLRLPVLDALEVAAAVTGDRSPTRIIVLSSYVQQALMMKALVVGAHGFLAKGTDRATLCDRVLAVGRGETVLPPSMGSRAATQLATSAQASAPKETGSR